MKTNNAFQQAFEPIRADDALKTSALSYLQAERRKRGDAVGQAEDAEQAERGGRTARKRPRAALRPVLALACALVLALGIGGGARVYGEPIAYLSIDVNPSIELSVNRWERVVGATAYNADGVAVLQGVSLNGMRYEDAVNALLTSDAMACYLAADNAELTMTVASNDRATSDAMLAWLKNNAICEQRGCRCSGADVSLLNEAHASGLSLGKYAVYQRLAQYDPTLTAEDCHGMTMAELHGLLREHEGGQGMGHGSGHGRHHGGE